MIDYDTEKLREADKAYYQEVDKIVEPHRKADRIIGDIILPWSAVACVLLSLGSCGKAVVQMDNNPYKESPTVVAYEKARRASEQATMAYNQIPDRFLESGVNNVDSLMKHSKEDATKAKEILEARVKEMETDSATATEIQAYLEHNNTAGRWGLTGLGFLILGPTIASFAGAIGLSKINESIRSYRLRKLAEKRKVFG